VSGAGPLTHNRGCPEPPPITRDTPTEHGDRAQWCPSCMRDGIAPSATRVHESDPERMATNHQEER